MLGDKPSKRLGIVDKLWGYTRITRPPNGLLMFLAALTGGYIASRSVILDPQRTLLVFFTAYGLNGSSMVINDIVDVESDKINAPWRPIPSGTVSLTGALSLATTLAALGLIAAFVTSFLCLIVAVAFYAIAVIYNIWLKPYGILGNSAVSLTVAAPFFYGSAAFTNSIDPSVIMLGLLAFLANNGREVIKGIMDVEGDAKRGVYTVARASGPKTAARVGAALYLAAVVLSPIPALANILGDRYLAFVLLADAGFVYSSLSIIKEPNATVANRVRKESLLWMLLALLSFIAGV